MERDINAWLDTAVRLIRFGPDRREVRAELEAHLEDKLEETRRLFPDMEGEEAGKRALKEMGDAEELGRTLGKLHKPWLGYLWNVSRWAARLLLAAFLIVTVVTDDHYASAGHPLWGEWATVYGRTQGQSAELGGYTFQIVGAAFLDHPEDHISNPDSILVAVRVSTPRFWERIDGDGLRRAATLFTGDGRVWPMEEVVVESGEKPPERVGSLHRAEWGLFHDTYIAHAGADWQEGDRARLEFSFGKGSFTLETGEIERVVMK